MIEFNINFDKVKKDFLKYLYANADEMFELLCYSDFHSATDPYDQFTESLSIEDIKSYLDEDGVNVLKNPADLDDTAWEALYSKLNDEFIDTNSTDYVKIINKFVSSKTKIFTYDVYGTMMPTPYTKVLLGKCYHFIRKYIRSELKQKEAIHTVNFIKEALQHCPTIINLKLSDGELLALSYLAKDVFGNKIFDVKIEQHNQKYYTHPELTDNKLMEKLHTYVKSHLRNILLHANFDKDENNMYSHSWLSTSGNYETDVEKNVLIQCLKKHKDEICKLLNIKIDDIWEFDGIIEYYCTQYPSILSTIYDFIRAKNGKIKKLRAEDLVKLQDDDKIGVKNSTSIDYDITADHVRSRPIIIIHDLKSDKDLVMFGPNGASHGFYVQNKLLVDCAKANIEVDTTKLGYGYALKNIAFIDERGDNFQVGYTLEDEVNILKNDPRIKKVYTTPGHPAPGGGPITRLAKLM